MAIIFSDTFDSANGANLNGHTAEVGGAWSGPTNWTIDATGLYSAVDGAFDPVVSSYTPEATTYNIEWTVDCTNAISGASNATGNQALMFCYADTDNWYWVRFTHSGGIDIYQKIVGAATALWESGSWTSGGTYVVRIEVDPTQAAVYINDLLVYTINDASLSRTGTLAMYTTHDSTSSSDRIYSTLLTIATPEVPTNLYFSETITGAPDGTYPVALYDAATKSEVRFVGSGTVASSLLQIPLDGLINTQGDALYGYVLDNQNPHVNGSVLVGDVKVI